MSAEGVNHMLATCALVLVVNFPVIEIIDFHGQSLSAVVSILVAVYKYCNT